MVLFIGDIYETDRCLWRPSLLGTGEWRTIYAAADNKEKIVEGGPLRGCYCQIECINDCEYLYTTFYAK